MKILLRHVALGALAVLATSVMVGPRIGNDQLRSFSSDRDIRLATHERAFAPPGTASWSSFYSTTRP